MVTASPLEACRPAVPTPSLTMLMDLVIEIAPYPAGSRISLSQPALTALSCAYCRDRQGAVGAPQPAASTPRPDTQTRLDAGQAWPPSTSARAVTSTTAVVERGRIPFP